MRRVFLNMNEGYATREDAEEACPWAAEIFAVESGWMCFESMTDAELFNSQAYRPSAAEVERSERQRDLISLFRSEY